MNIFSIELWLLFSIISIPIWFVASYQITKSIIGSIITGTIITFFFPLSFIGTYRFITTYSNQQSFKWIDKINLLNMLDIVNGRMGIIFVEECRQLKNIVGQ